jgi:hypothetical protein
MAARAIYIISVACIANGVFLFVRTHFSNSDPRYSALFVCLFPGIIYLNLYSVVNLLAVAIQIYAIYFLSVFMGNNKLRSLFIFSAICGAGYLTRVDSIIIFISGLFLIFFQKFRCLSFLELSKIVMVSTITFLSLIFFWQFHLYSNDLIFSQGVSAGLKNLANWNLAINGSSTQ